MHGPLISGVCVTSEDLGTMPDEIRDHAEPASPFAGLAFSLDSIVRELAPARRLAGPHSSLQARVNRLLGHVSRGADSTSPPEVGGPTATGYSRNSGEDPVMMVYQKPEDLNQTSDFVAMNI